MRSVLDKELWDKAQKKQYAKQRGHKEWKSYLETWKLLGGVSYGCTTMDCQLNPYMRWQPLNKKHLQWNKGAIQASEYLKKALMSAPALGFPDVSKPFFVFSDEKQGIVLGIVAQDLGLYRQTVAYLSKQLDTTAKGWPGCFQAVAAVILTIQKAWKFTLSQKITVLASHTVSAVLEMKDGHWLSSQRFLKYQAKTSKTK